MDRDNGEQPKKPAQVVRDGNIKASVWENEGENGRFYATTFSRSYKDQEGNIRDTNNFVGTDLLKLSELARETYTRTNALARKERAQRREAFLEKREPAQDHERKTNRDR